MAHTHAYTHPNEFIGAAKRRQKVKENSADHFS